ncbi:MAG: M20/M25/M40 family metallo-hydrolase [Acidimicrobiales bacterium]|nr:M20/M25/M40 family metallo-hydrolase [Acidimicrobiales bacterium]MCB1260311.1 M20/M25/M40 family metallo-hydrolase [Acidimicrobiales bacterium]
MSDGDTSDPAETVELLQHLIRNACVNDGTVGSGHEARSAALLADYLGVRGLDADRFEPAPGRESLVARIEGSDPSAPTMVWLAHTDVVPVNADRWRHDPFGGELIDGEVWGRGAVDMLNLTASMAVAFKRLADGGFAPRGSLVFVGVADEEAAGTYGADHLVSHEWEAVAGDYVLTESGGIPIPTPAGIALPVIVGEKGCYWCRLRVRGTPGHGSRPYRTDNALVKAAAVVARLDAHVPETMIHDTFERFVDALGLPDELRQQLRTPDGLRDALGALPVGMARELHACTHLTMAPTVVHGGVKTNVIPDVVELDVDIRTLPGQTPSQAHAVLVEALGDLAVDVEIEPVVVDPATASPTDTPMWDALARATQRWYPGSRTVPYLSVGATDARFFRRAGAVGYGFGLFSERMRFEDFGAMFHGDDERVDIESLALSTDLWEAVARDVLA